MFILLPGNTQKKFRKKFHVLVGCFYVFAYRVYRIMDLLLLWGVVKVTYEIVLDYVKNGTDGHRIFFWEN